MFCHSTKMEFLSLEYRFDFCFFICLLLSFIFVIGIVINLIIINLSSRLVMVIPNIPKTQISALWKDTDEWKKVIQDPTQKRVLNHWDLPCLFFHFFCFRMIFLFNTLFFSLSLSGILLQDQNTPRFLHCEKVPNVLHSFSLKPLLPALPLPQCEKVFTQKKEFLSFLTTDQVYKKMDRCVSISYLFLSSHSLFSLPPSLQDLDEEIILCLLWGHTLFLSSFQLKEALHTAKATRIM